jgi:hypothetical protein
MGKKFYGRKEVFPWSRDQRKYKNGNFAARNFRDVRKVNIGK